MADWLTLEELAGYLKMGKSTLYKMAQLGEIPAKKIGRSWRFDRDEIDSWLRRQTAHSGIGERKSTSRRSSKRGAK